MNKICICHNSVKTGQTSVMCCNVCGLPDEDFWQPSLSTETGQQGMEARKIFEYIQRNANKINEHTWKAYKEQILAHVEDGLAISSQPQETGQQGYVDEGLYPHSLSQPKETGQQGVEELAEVIHQEFKTFLDSGEITISQKTTFSLHDCFTGVAKKIIERVDYWGEAAQHNAIKYYELRADYDMLNEKYQASQPQEGQDELWGELFSDIGNAHKLAKLKSKFTLIKK